jgi:hypothetical protein
VRVIPVFFGAAFLTACSQAPTTTAAAPIATIRQAGYYEPVLNLELDFGGARNGGVLAQAGQEVLQIGKSMIAGKPPVAGKIETINFVVLGKAGSDSTVGRKIAHFSYPAQELRQIAHMGGTGDSTLDAARDVGTWTPANADVLDEYCAGKPSSSFCDAAK